MRHVVSPFDVANTMRWRRWLPIAAVLGAAACWATQGVAYALILNGIQTDGLTVVTLRAVTATLVLWVWLAVTDPGALRIPKASLPAFTLLGAIAVTIFYPALFYTYQWTSVSVATTLLYLSPTLVTLGAALFLGEPFTAGKLIALVTTFFGSALVVQVYQPENLRGSAAGIGLRPDRRGHVRDVQRARQEASGAVPDGDGPSRLLAAGHAPAPRRETPGFTDHLASTAGSDRDRAVHRGDDDAPPHHPLHLRVESTAGQ